jgi:hypothetical protein
MDTVQQLSPEKRLPRLATSQLDAFERQQAEREFGMAFDSSTSGPESSTQSSHDEVLHVEQRLGLGIDINKKPLPDIPSNPEPNISGHTIHYFHVPRYPQFDTGTETLEPSPQLGFSFKPGDDLDIIAHNTVRDGNAKDVLGVSTYQSRSTTSEEQSETSYMSTQCVGGARRPKSTPLSAKHKLQSKRGIARDIQDNESLKRDDSTSSIITAVRANSGHSIESSRHSNRNLQQKLTRSSGSSEAITAAARAIAGAPASVRGSASTQKGSGFGAREKVSRGEESPRTEEGDKGSSEHSRKASSVRSEVLSNASPPQSSLKQDKRLDKT